MRVNRAEGQEQLTEFVLMNAYSLELGLLYSRYTFEVVVILLVKTGKLSCSKIVRFKVLTKERDRQIGNLIATVYKQRTRSGQKKR